MNSSGRRRTLPFIGALVLGVVILLIPGLALARVTLPARIQAEDYDNASGIYTTTTEDTDGGDDVYSVDNPDWMEYEVYVPTTGEYTFTIRVRAGESGNYFRIEIDDEDVTGTVGPSVGEVYTDVVVTDVELEAGNHDLKYYQVVNWNWNNRINWIEVESETPPTVAFTASSQSPSEGAGTVTVTAQLSASTGSTVTVPFTLSGTATETTDYSITSSPITISSGQTTGTATITITDDSLDENDETVIVTMGTPTNATQGATTVHTATITDNDATPTVTFTAASQSPSEGAGTATVTAQLSATSGLTVTVPYTLGGTATESTDYTISASPITITAGQTTGTATITITDDSLDENDETVIVTMGTPTNATQGATTVHTATITDNDATPTVSFTAASQSPGEGAGTATVTAQLSAASGLTVTVPYTLGGTATESTDYTISTSPITITAGQTTGTATITITDDSLDENDETVIVTMGTPTNATQGATTVHTATITDNDVAPTVTFTAASQSPSEGAGTATVTAQLSAASGLTVTVPYTLSGTATESTDYTISASPITITAGQTTGTATITITDDSLDENDETVIVTMGTPTNATQGATTVHTATITDNDATPTVTFTAASQSVGEGAGTATVTAQLSTASGLTVTVPFTLGGTATETTDYTITSSPITISAGQTTGTATVTIVDDTAVESSETVIVTMGTPTNASQGATTVHTLTITDNDSANTAPNADAGDDDAINLSDSVSLDGTVSDDGLPNPPASVTTTWSKQSGPGTVTFGSTSSVDTTAVFSQAGTYVLRLTADDSSLSDYDEVTVVVVADGVVILPARIQAEDYDDQSGVYTTTTEDVDGGDDAYSVDNPDWMEYEVYAPSTGEYTLTIRVRSANTGDYFRIEIDDEDVTGTIGPSEAAVYTDVVAEDVEIEAGTHTLKYYQVVNWNWNNRINWIEVELESVSPTVTFTASSQSPSEGAGTTTVTAQLSASTGSTVTVPFTLSGTATETTDYSITSSPIIITSGQTTGTATITIVDDSLDESDETVIVTMGTPTNATQGATTVHTVTITDNDSAPSVSFTSASQSQDEDAGTATVTAQLSAASGLTVTVPFTLGGTATETTDYTITSSPITITAGQTTGTATITIVDDTAVESSETVIVTMGTPTNASQGATTVHTLTITDDDGSGNSAPIVDVGPDQAVNISNSVTLDATVTDDNLPDPPDTVTTTWTMQSGPGTVTFGSTSSVDTTAIFDTVGTYVLRLTADDSSLTAYDELTVAVVADSVFVLPCKVEVEDYRDGGEGVAYHDGSGTPDTTSCSDTGGGYCLYNFEESEWTTYDIYVPEDAWFKFTLRAAGFLDSQEGTVYIDDDEDTVGLFRFTASYEYGVDPETYTDVVIDGVFLTAGSHVLKFAPGSYHWSFNVNYINIESSQDGPVVDAGADQEITQPTVVSLDATITDNGLPNPPGEVTQRWIQVSGPSYGLAVFDDRFAVDTTVTFDSAGTYVLRLIADDSIAESSDDVTITVNEATDRITLPDRLEAEDYADQGEGTSYHDTTSGNAGSVYRSDDVDIESCGDTGGGYDVYTIAADEWLAFDVEVPADTTIYDITARVNSSTSSRQMHIEVDDVDVTGAMTFDSTGGWTDVTAEGVYIAPGRHVIKVVMDTGDFQLNYVDVLAETYEEYIVENNTANADIVISSSPYTTVDFAAEELQDIIYDITGATLPIVTTPTAADVHIYVGESSYTSSLGISTAGLEYDAFKIVTGSDWIALVGADTEYVPIEPTSDSTADEATWDAITGSTYEVPMVMNGRNYNWSLDIWQSDGCGSLQAVYEFLRTLGCRWYYPGSDVVPTLDDIGLPAINRTVVPDYPCRHMMMYNHEFGAGASEDEVRWQLRLGLNMGHDSQGWVLSHGIGYVTGRDEMKVANPTYYALINDVRDTEGWKGDGNPCLSSTGLMAENVNFLECVFDHYGEPMCDISPPDGFAMCECNLCEGKASPERGMNGIHSNYIHNYANDVAEEVYLTYPSRKISVQAYANYHMPPQDIEEFSPNIVINYNYWALWLYEQEDYDKYMKELDDWLELLPSDQFLVSDFCLSGMPYQDPGNPAYYPQILKRELSQYAHEGTCIGKFNEVGWNYVPDGYDYTALEAEHLNIYVTGRLFWDADLDLPALMDDYYEKFYGPAAEEMKDFVEYCEANFEWPLTTSSVITTMRTKLNAAITAANGTGVYEDRVDMMDTFFSHMEE